METKRCTKCGEEKPIEEFYKDSRAKDGKTVWCKTCMRIDRKRRYLKNRDCELSQMKKYQREHRSSINERSREWATRNREAKRIYECGMTLSEVELVERYPGEACYLAKARKLMRGEIVDPHCDAGGEE